jgi:hypothetical protein
MQYYIQWYSLSLQRDFSPCSFCPLKDIKVQKYIKIFGDEKKNVQ